MARPILFLDRDGVIIHDVGYPKTTMDVVFTGNIFSLIVQLRDKYDIVVVSNQSGVSKGIISITDFLLVHRTISASFYPGEISNWLYCFHAPEDNCSCRKPAIGLVKQYEKRKKAGMIGNSQCDEYFAKAMNIPYYDVNKYSLKQITEILL